MPFKSEAQRRLCYVKYSQDIKKGVEPKWDCKKWDKETKKKLPWLINEVHTGPRGGKYIIKNGKKVYV